MSRSEERLQKVIARSGLTSRRKAEKLIVAGKVKVNDEIVSELGTRVTDKDIVKVNNVPLKKEKHVYYMLNKPKKVISSLHDEKGRKIVTDFFENVQERIYPIGRLDYRTTGLILLTNDGDFANYLMHPRYEVEKVYEAVVQGVPSPKELAFLTRGIRSDQDILKAVDYKVLATDKQNKSMKLQLTLQEGKNRHIRRMMEQLGYPALHLHRAKYGHLSLGDLKPGEYRSLTKAEISQLGSLARENVRK